MIVLVDREPGATNDEDANMEVDITEGRHIHFGLFQHYI